MTLINHETGELIESLSKDDARRLTDRIRLLSETIAETLDKLADLIDQARVGSAWLALGYRSWTEYVSVEFASVLPRLDREPRQEFVKELASRGMSSRAIAPVVGVADRQVRRDLSGGTSVPPPSSSEASPADDEEPEIASAEAGATGARAVEATATSEEPEGYRAPRHNVTGIDGKQYTRPEPRPAPLRSPEQQNAEEFAVRFAGQMFSLQAMQHAHMRRGAIEKWRTGRSAVSPVQAPYASPEKIRAVAEGLLALADEWEQTRA